MKKAHFDLLRELVALRPISADPAAVDRAQLRLKQFLEDHGIICRLEKIENRQLLFASTTGNPTPTILFNPHLDVVPATDPERQYELYEQDGNIYGRGAGDDLGNAICVAQALIDLKDSGVDAGAIFTGNEEVGGSTTLGMMELGYGAQKMVLVVDGNAGANQIIYAHKGVAVLKLIAHGRTGHSSRPWEFDNAIDKLIVGYSKLAEVWDNPDSIDDWRATMAPCIISGGQAVNQIPGEASLILNFRIVDSEDLTTLPQKVRDITGLEVEFRRSSLPFNGDRNSPQLQLLAQVIKDQTGVAPEFSRMTGATDARHLQGLGVPVAVIGCNGAGPHSENEYLYADAIDEMTPIFVEFAKRL